MSYGDPPKTPFNDYYGYMNPADAFRRTTFLTVMGTSQHAPVPSWLLALDGKPELKLSIMITSI